MKILGRIVFLVLFSLGYTYGQCPNSGTNSGITVTPTTTSQFTGDIRAGRYFTMNVTNGRSYTVSTCGLATWDTQLTIYRTTGAFVAYNDDACGTRSSTTFTANFTGQVRVIVNEFNCGSANNRRTQVEYFQLPISVAVSNVTVAEEDGNAVFTLTLSGDVSGGFSVDYQSFDNSAYAGVDYSAVSGTVSFSGTDGETQTVSVPLIDDAFGEPTEFVGLFLNNATNGVSISDNTGFATITDTDTANVPLDLFEEFNGYFDYAVTGGTLRTNDNVTDPCSITTSSSNTLTTAIPGTATIKKAYLYWAHSGLNIDNQVTFEGQTVTADVEYNSYLTGGRNLFGLVSDVTTIVQGVANPSTNSYDFSDLTIDNDDIGPDYCSTSVVLGGWSLMIFYEEPTLPAVTINLYQGFNGLSNAGTSFTLDSFFAIAGAGAKATFLSWEGDSTLDGASAGSTNPEELSVTNQLGFTNVLSGDGGNPGNNAYNSTIFDNTAGINLSNIHGLDLDTFDISGFINPTDNQVTVNVDVGQDFVISNAVVIKVPSNLISGTVFEDVNYGGGDGRNQTDASGISIAGAIVELYNSLGALEATTTTDINGDYSFGGMANGTYSIRVVNSSLVSNRGGGSSCTTCYAVQTYRSENITGPSEIIGEVGGANPASQDVGPGTLTGAQSISTVSIASNGKGNIDFGFNFNTIVNTNEDGQGSLEQFIVNSNNLDETGLDIESNSIFDPAPGEDTSIFMIPPTGDPQGRTADANFGSGYFDIFISNANPLSAISSDNTKIDGRTQTAYSSNTNAGAVGSGGTSVGTSAVVLPTYERPEIQVHRNAGDVFIVDANDIVIRNLSVYANNNAGIRLDGGSLDIISNLIGVNAAGANAGNIKDGIEIRGGQTVVDSNYIATNTDSGIWIQGGSSTLVQNNHIVSNGNAPCDDNITLISGSNISIQQNLIENAASLGIDGDGIAGNIAITENTITGSGQDGGTCSGNIENAGILLDGDNSTISNNIIFSNGGPGLVLAGGTTSGNLISQNSFYANGTAANSLGIDLDNSDSIGDGVTLNDSGDADAGPNDSLNFPLISGTYLAGPNLIVEGWSRPGAIIEWFITDITEGTATAGDNQLGLINDYGEGQTFIGSFVEGSADDTDTRQSNYVDNDGNTDNTNKFKFTIPAPPGITLANLVTATATISNSTSEFSPVSEVRTYTVITNRKITYRVKKDQ
ncbi:beta strand repeat-containing protein [Maribacter aestuarii]|uniref:beta strand repeat-containing protein n=1 Tax=Maribacter aestuarii TaxID=1130723 RepID=UPI0025A515A3|nr:right-handed parallel beta-helix repeat-containing protein [Maribacter aestuarii]